MVFGQDRTSKGSGNADSQRKVRSFTGIGRTAGSRSDSGCVLPTLLLAGFCFLSALRRLGALRLGTQGSREITRSFRALKQRTSYKEFFQ